MKVIEIAGGAYCEALPSGEWMCVPRRGGPIQTSDGPIETGGVTPLFARLSKFDGRLLVAGQVSGVVVFERGKDPILLERGSYGTSPCAWDETTGDLWMVDATATIRILDPRTFEETGARFTNPGAQGLRYVRGGRYATGDETYARAGMNEWTHLAADVYVGQGAAGGLVIERGGVLRQVTTGDTRFVRSRMDANGVIAIGYWNIAEDKSVLIWMPLNDIANLPVVGANAPNPGTDPTPDPEPKPDPEEKPLESLLGRLALARSKYGDGMTSDQCVEMLNLVLWTAPDKGWRLFQKFGGSAGGHLSNGVKVSHDFLIHVNGQCVDCLGDAGGGGASSPQWGLRDQISDNDEDNQSRWVKPIEPKDAPIDEPDEPAEEPEEPTPGDNAAVQALIEMITRLNAEIVSLRMQMADVIRASQLQMRDLSERIDRDSGRLLVIEDRLDNKSIESMGRASISIPLIGTRSVNVTVTGKVPK